MTGYGVLVGRTIKRVGTAKGQQSHRGWRGWVILPDGNRVGCSAPLSCFHKTREGARACGVKTAKRISGEVES